MKILYLISIALLICTNLNGQTSLTLQEAVNYGTNNNVEYKNANLDLQIAQQKVKESISTGLPKIQRPFFALDALAGEINGVGHVISIRPRIELNVELAPQRQIVHVEGALACG